MTDASRQIVLRRANPADAADIARIIRAALASFDWMPVLHTPDEDLAFIANQVLPHQAVTVAEAGENVVGFIAVKGEWIEHLYLDPAFTGGGIGSRLVMHAIEIMPMARLH